MPPSIVSFFSIGKRLSAGLCTRAIQRVLTMLTHWKFYPHCFMGKTNQAVGPERRKKMRREARWNPRRSCHILGSRSKRERPVTNASGWVTVNFFITRDTTFATYVYEEGHVRVTNSITNRFIDPFYERFAWLFSLSIVATILHSILYHVLFPRLVTILLVSLSGS